MTISDPSYPTDVTRAQGAAILATMPETTASGRQRGTSRFGRFQILTTLGQGGFGIVFLAWDPTLRRQVALKVPQPETLMTPEARKRFQREAHAAAGLDHPNIVPVYETGSVGSVTYIAAAYCPGPTLADWLARQVQPLPVRDAARLVATLAHAVEHAHERGVLHRDLKPSNILLKHAAADDLAHGNNEPLDAFEPRITDFSLSKIADGSGPETKSGVPFGSPPYMAPEQAEGKLKLIGPPTDVYGLGCILYELLAGSPPFRGEGQLDTLRRVIADVPIPLRRVRKDTPVELEAIVLKCLEKNPARRFPSARDLADDLDRFIAGEPTRARPPGRWKRLSRRAKRHPAPLAVMSIATTCVIIVVLGWRWYEARLQTVHRHSVQREEQARAADASNLRHRQYVNAIRQADQLIRAYQAPLAREVLLRQRPGAGEDDLREFAWHYLLRRCHTEQKTLTGHRGEIYYIEFSKRGDLLASAGKDGAVLIWNTVTWKLVQRITASTKEVNVAAFSPDGQTIATVDDEGCLKLWNTITGHLILKLPAHKGDAVIARFTPDGKTIITGGRNDGIIKLWDRSEGVMREAFQVIDHDLENAIIFPDGLKLVTAGGTSEDAKIWSLSSAGPIATLRGSRGAQGIAVSHDGTLLATGHEGDRLIRLWEAASGRLIREIGGHRGGVFSVVFTSDDQTLISAGDDGTIRFWSVADGSQRGVHQGHANRIWTLALSPDGHTLASSGRNGTVKLWDPNPPPKLPRLPVPNPHRYVFSPNGKSLMVTDYGHPWFVSRLQDTESGSLVERTPLDYSLPFFHGVPFPLTDA